MAMKLKAEQVYDMTVGLTDVIKEDRPMSQKAAYRLAYWRDKLYPTYKLLEDRRSEIVKSYGYHREIGYLESVVDGETVRTPQYSEEFFVPADKADDYAKAWQGVFEEADKDGPVEYAIDPRPISLFEHPDHPGGALSAKALTALLPLIDPED